MITEMKTFRFMPLFAFALFFAASACANVTSFASPEYLQWLDELKQEMADRGISRKTLDKVYRKVGFVGR